MSCGLGVMVVLSCHVFGVVVVTEEFVCVSAECVVAEVVVVCGETLVLFRCVRDVCSGDCGVGDDGMEGERHVVGVVVLESGMVVAW